MMTNAIERREQAQSIEQRAAPKELTLDTVASMTGYELPQIALIAKTVAVGAPLIELAVFLHSCKTLGLDPVLRQAYWIRRKSREQVDGEWRDVYKGALQVGIDGFRAIAERSGAYAGSEPAEFRGRLEWTYKNKAIVVPETARVIVWKIVAGHKAAFTGEAHWAEFVPPEGQAQMYAKMPRHMLAKNAEAQALRKAFPALLGAIQMVAEHGELPADLPEVAAPRMVVEPSVRHADAAATYDKIYTAHYDGPPDPSQSVEPPPTDVREAAPDLPPGAASDTTMVKSVRNQRYQELIGLAEALEAAGLDATPYRPTPPIALAEVDRLIAEAQQAVSAADTDPAIQAEF